MQGVGAIDMKSIADKGLGFATPDDGNFIIPQVPIDSEGITAQPFYYSKPLAPIVKPLQVIYTDEVDRSGDIYQDVTGR